MSSKTTNSSDLSKDSADASSSSQASDRQSNGEVASISNDQTVDDQNTDGQGENTCELSWATRNEIIQIMSEYSKFLLSKSIGECDKKKLAEGHFGIYRTLINLPLEGGSTERSKEIVLQLDSAMKSKIFHSLVKNHSLAFVDDRSTSRKRKLEQLEENNELLSSLVKLPVKMAKQAASGESSGDKEAESSLVLSKDNGNEFVKRSEMNVQIAAFSKQIGGLIDVIDGFRKTIQLLDIYRSEAFFSYEFTNIRAFLNDITDTRLRSDFFHCRGKQFYIVLRKTFADQTIKYLGIYIYVVDADPVDWYLDVSYEICLLNQLPGGENRARRKTDQRIMSDKRSGMNPGNGKNDFITPTDLMEQGFLKNDKIVVQIKLKSGRLNRNC